MLSQFTLERQAHERHQAHVREAARDRLLHESPTLFTTTRTAIAGLTVFTLIFVSSALTFVTHISSETVLG